MKLRATGDVSTNLNAAVTGSVAMNGVVASILADHIYSDKVGAPVREYLANALDETRKYNCEVPLIEQEGVVARVTDYGVGLSEEDVLLLFTTHGASTKNNDNSSIGGFGVGSKSWAADSDSVTISSRCAGKSVTVIGYKNADSTTQFSVVERREMKPEEKSGVTVEWQASHSLTLLARIKKYTEFVDCTVLLDGVQYKCTNNPAYAGANWATSNDGSQPYNTSFIVTMGGIPYETGRPNLFGFSVVYHGSVGQFMPDASRQRLAEDSTTQATLERVYKQVKKELGKTVQEKILDDNLSLYDKVYKYFELHDYNLRVAIKPAINLLTQDLVGTINNCEFRIQDQAGYGSNSRVVWKKLSPYHRNELLSGVVILVDKSTIKSYARTNITRYSTVTCLIEGDMTDLLYLKEYLEGATLADVEVVMWSDELNKQHKVKRDKHVTESRKLSVVPTSMNSNSYITNYGTQCFSLKASGKKQFERRYGKGTHLFYVYSQLEEHDKYESLLVEASLLRYDVSIFNVSKANAPALRRRANFLELGTEEGDRLFFKRMKAMTSKKSVATRLWLAGRARASFLPNLYHTAGLDKQVDEAYMYSVGGTDIHAYECVNHPSFKKGEADQQKLETAIRRKYPLLFADGIYVSDSLFLRYIHLEQKQLTTVN